jgi:hypothetical protein
MKWTYSRKDRRFASSFFLIRREDLTMWTQRQVGGVGDQRHRGDLAVAIAVYNCEERESPPEKVRAYVASVDLPPTPHRRAIRKLHV